MVLALTRVMVLCSWVRHFSLTSLCLSLWARSICGVTARGGEGSLEYKKGGGARRLT